VARPTKQGIDYFPLDVQFDDKIELLIADKGAIALSILITIWQLIYQNEGYYIANNNDLLLLVRRRIMVDVETVRAIVDSSIERGIFNKEMCEMHKILTSKALQKRYFVAAKLKKVININKNYLLIGINDDGNSNCLWVNDIGNATNVEVEVEVEVDVKEDVKVEKNKRNIFSEDSNEIKLSKLLFNKLCLINPYQKTPNFQAWAKEIDLTIRVDARTLEMLTGAINWTFSDPFWSTVIQSPKSLRKNFDKLYTNAKRDKNGTARSGITEDVLRERARIIASDPDLRRD